jgi:hypothetical protein
MPENIDIRISKMMRIFKMTISGLVDMITRDARHITWYCIQIFFYAEYFA